MARTDDQLELDIVAERFTDREKKIRALLHDFRTIDRRIEFLSKQAQGDELPFEPSITVQPPKRDMMAALKYTYHGQLSQGESEIASTVEKYVEVNGYASQYRVARVLKQSFSDDAEEDERLQLAYNLLERDEEPRVHMTESERLAHLRAPYIERARKELAELIEIRESVQYALDTVEMWSRQHYLLLWYRDVMQRPVSEVCRMAGLNFGTELETYKKKIRKARVEVAKWIPEYLLS